MSWFGNLFSRVRASADDEDRSVFGDFWFSSIARRGIAGMRVGPEQAMRLGAVYACVRNVSEDFAKLPFRMYKEEPDGTRGARVTNHWLHRLLVKSPNRWQTPFDFVQMLEAHLELRGNAFCDPVVNGSGEILELLPLHPDRVKIDILPSGDFRYQVRQPNGTTALYPRGALWHLKGLAADIYRGYNPVELQADALGVGLAAQSYAGRYFANDAKPSGGWLEHPSNFKDKTQRDTFRESWQDQQSGANRGRLAVLEYGMKYHDVTINNKESQFIEARQLSRSEIAAMWRVPPHKIGDLTRATFSNIEQQSIEYGTDCIGPRAKRWESSIECDLLGEDSGYCVEFDLRQLMRGDSKARAEYYASGINAGWLTRNEARAEEGMDPLDGLDEPLQPLNMVEVGADPEPVQAPANQADDQPPADDGQDDPTDARLVSIAMAAAERIARRETQVVMQARASEDWQGALLKAYERHAEFVSAALGVNHEAALAYCGHQGHFIFDNPACDAAEFTAIAQSRLERLALKGTP